LIRVNSLVQSFLIVSGRSKGKLSYIFPPLKWHGMHFDLKIGLSWVSKSTRAFSAEEVETFADETTTSGIRAGLATPPDSINNNPTAIAPSTIRMAQWYA
jgi:hypothetical protein